MARHAKKMACKRSLSREQILGYTREQLRAHLESQFRPGMSWESGGFHVDHIKPSPRSFVKVLTDPAVIHALDNLQILTPHENLTKSDKFPFLQVPASFAVRPIGLYKGMRWGTSARARWRLARAPNHGQFPDHGAGW